MCMCVCVHVLGIPPIWRSVIFLLLLIARSKLVPDFALTIHGLHLVVVSFYTKQIPSAMFWWALQGASALLMIFLGMWACQWRELKPIAFGGRAKGDRVVASGSGRDRGEEGEGEGEGFGVGAGSRGVDGAGVYEMLGMTPKDEAV